MTILPFLKPFRSLILGVREGMEVPLASRSRRPNCLTALPIIDF
jgi:hypothetical protein